MSMNTAATIITHLQRWARKRQQHPTMMTGVWSSCNSSNIGCSLSSFGMISTRFTKISLPQKMLYYAYICTIGRLSAWILTTNRSVTKNSTVDSINLDPRFLFIIRKNKYDRKNSWKKHVYLSPYLTRFSHFKRY